MPNWLRVLLLVFAAGVLVLIIGGVFAVRWLKNQGPELEKRGKAVQADARKFAEGKKSNDCVDEGLRRAGASKGFFSMIETRVFVDECLKVAEEPPEFCASVPTGMIDGAKWAADECAKKGMAGDQGCSNVFQAVMDHCRKR